MIIEGMTRIAFYVYHWEVSRIDKHYNIMWSRAVSAEAVLRCNEWHRIKMKRVRARFTRRIVFISKISEVIRDVRGCISERIGYPGYKGFL